MKYRRAVFAVVYAKNKGEIEYLILKRKLHWKGWEFPKGKIELFESKKKTVMREVFEETGLRPIKNKIRKFDFSGKYKYKKILSDRPKIIGQTFSLYGVEVKFSKKVSLDGKEHSGFEWVSFEKGLKKLTWPNQRKSLRIVDKWLRNN
jgi:8-oxo-dGTP pyrophosphatase MutT (NUDIX family)